MTTNITICTTIIVIIISILIIVIDATGFYLHHQHQTPKFSYSYTINHLNRLNNNDRPSRSNNNDNDLINQPSSSSTRINHHNNNNNNNQNHHFHFGSQSNKRLYPYLEKPFQLLCSKQSKFHRGFYVGRSDDNKHCYYVCPDNPDKIPIGRVNYFCCRSGFGFDFVTKVCIRTQSINPTKPPIVQNNNNNNHNRWSFQPTKWSNPWNNNRNDNRISIIKTGIKSTKPECMNGETKPHPYDCQKYYRCLFNLKFVEMKCPFNFGWNPIHKLCDPTYRQQCRPPILKPPISKNDNIPMIKSKWPSKFNSNRFGTKFNKRVCLDFFF